MLLEAFSEAERYLAPSKWCSGACDLVGIKGDEGDKDGNLKISGNGCHSDSKMYDASEDKTYWLLLRHAIRGYND